MDNQEFSTDLSERSSRNVLAVWLSEENRRRGLQADSEQGVDGLLDEPGPGDILRSDPRGCLGQQRVSPAIDEGERTRSVEVVAKARPHSG